MKILVVGKEPETAALLDDLTSGRGLSVVHCLDRADANRELRDAAQPFDWVVIEGEDPDARTGTGFDDWNAPAVAQLSWWRRHRGAKDPARGPRLAGSTVTEFPGKRRDFAILDEYNYMFEYHAPAKVRSGR